MDITAKLQEVHDRIGNPPGGLTIYSSTVVGGPIRVQWKRSYDGILSDERDLEVESGSLLDVLQAIIAYEDDADANETPSTRVRILSGLDADEQMTDEYVSLLEERYDALHRAATALMDYGTYDTSDPSPAATALRVELRK